MVVSVAIRDSRANALFRINRQLQLIPLFTALRDGKKGWNIG